MFSFTSAIVLSAVSFSVFFKATAEYTQGQLNPDAYPLFGITFAAVVVCAILASAAGTHRQIPFLHEVSREKGEPIRFVVLVRELSGLAKNRSFLAFFLMSITFFVVAGIQRALTLHMNTYFWALETDEIQYLFYAFFAVTLAAIPFVKSIIDLLDKKRTMYLGLWIIILAFVLPTILRLIGWFPENGSGLLLPLLLVDQSVAGVGMGILSVCSGSIVADLADDHELHSGQRQEGMLFGFLTLATKATSGAGQFLAGLALALIAFPTGQDVSPGGIEPNVLFDLGLVYGPIVALFGLLCIYLFSFYGISRTSHEATLRTLQERRRSRDSAS
jgi:Na+/melibiose symporter-like transporter